MPATDRTLLPLSTGFATSAHTPIPWFRGVIAQAVIRPEQSRENCCMTLLCDETKLYRPRIPSYGAKVNEQAAGADAEEGWISARKFLR
jgi:hypothetical protein